MWRTAAERVRRLEWRVTDSLFGERSPIDADLGFEHRHNPLLAGIRRSGELPHRDTAMARGRRPSRREYSGS
jgi:hypothetical protein